MTQRTGSGDRVSDDMVSDEIELLDSTATAAKIEPAIPNERRWPLLSMAVVLGIVIALVVLLGVVERGSESATQPSAIESAPEPPLEIAAGVEQGDGPVLGRKTGFSLMVGGTNTPLRVLDLDTGDLTVSEAMLSPQFLAGSTLIFTTDAPTWARAPLDDYRAAASDNPPAVRFNPIGDPARVLPSGAEAVWLTWPRTEGGRYWQLIDLATSEVLREVTTPINARMLGGTDPFVGPEVISSSDGGVFELQAVGVDAIVAIAPVESCAIRADPIARHQVSVTIHNGNGTPTAGQDGVSRSRRRQQG